MKTGMLFGLSHREKRVKKIHSLHFPFFTSKNFVILKLPNPSTDCLLRSLVRLTILHNSILHKLTMHPWSNPYLWLIWIQLTREKIDVHLLSYDIYDLTQTRFQIVTYIIVYTMNDEELPRTRREKLHGTKTRIYARAKLLVKSL